jgi:hypothetical protein
MSGRYNVKPPRERNYPAYRYKDLLASIGSDLDIQDVIVGYGFEAPSVHVIKGWRRRNSVPPKWLPLLMHFLMQKGVLKEPTQLLKGPF